MAEVRFFGQTEHDYFSLQRADAGAMESIALKASHVMGGSEKWNRDVRVSRAELNTLADWLDEFWNDTPPVKLANGLIQFVYSHREHIGEGYYGVEFDGVRLLLAYEQLGGSNRFRAAEVRALLD
jgi:hypothetical protein